MLTPAELKDAEQAAHLFAEYEERRLNRLNAALEQEARLARKINIKALIAVHLTDHFPTNGVMKPLGTATRLSVQGKPVYFPRETLHFSLNGAVGSHMYGEWDGKKYVILVPLPLIFDRVFSLSPEDTFIIGELKLPRGSEVLASPENLAGKYAGTAILTPFLPGEDAHQAARRRIKEKGYIVADIQMWSWSFSYEAQAEAVRTIGQGEEVIGIGSLRRLITNAGKEQVSHLNTIFADAEEFTRQAYLLIYTKKKIGTTYTELHRGFQKVRAEMEELLRSKKDKSIFISPEELAAITRIISLMAHLDQEIVLAEHQESAELTRIKDITKLDEKERKWLLREFYLVKNLGRIVTLKDKGKAKGILRKIVRTERRVYRFYREFQEQLQQLKSDTGFTVDLSDIEKQLEVWEAHFAIVFSRQAGSLTELVEKGQWPEVSQQVEKMEGAIAAVEKILTDLQAVLEAREKYFEKASAGN